MLAVEVSNGASTVLLQEDLEEMEHPISYFSCLINTREITLLMRKNPFTSSCITTLIVFDKCFPIQVYMDPK